MRRYVYYPFVPYSWSVKKVRVSRPLQNREILVNQRNLVICAV